MKLLVPTLLCLVAGCTMRPQGEEAERARADGFQFARPLAEREIPELSANPSLEDCVRHALLASPSLEVEYQKWRATLERIPQVSSQFTTAEVGLSVLTGTGQPSLLERTNLLAMTDSSFGIVWPEKLAAQGRAALEKARAAGFHFDQMRGELRATVTSAYVDLTLATELQKLQRENLTLVAATIATLTSRLRTGDANPQDLVRARVQHDLAENEILTLEATARQRRAKLNALLGRTDPDAPLTATMPDRRPLAFDETRLLEHLRERNPELKEHTRDVLAAEQVLAAKRQEWIPDLALSASLARATQTLGATLTLPFLRSAAIHGEIAEAKAMLNEAEAYRRKMQSDMARDAIVELSLWRDARRQTELFATTVVPAAERAARLLRTSYGVGKASFLDLVDAQRMVIETRRMALAMRAEEARSQAELERIAHSHEDPERRDPKQR